MMEAGTACTQGQYEEAKAKAQKAEVWHGLYTILDPGERPQNLLAEIEVAHAKTPKSQSLPPVPMQNASKELNPSSGTAVKAPNNSSMMTNPSVPMTSGSYQIPDMNAQVSGLHTMPRTGSPGSATADSD